MPLELKSNSFKLKNFSSAKPSISDISLSFKINFSKFLKLIFPKAISPSTPIFFS